MVTAFFGRRLSLYERREQSPQLGSVSRALAHLLLLSWRAALELPLVDVGEVEQCLGHIGLPFAARELATGCCPAFQILVSLHASAPRAKDRGKYCLRPSLAACTRSGQLLNP